jgi:putative heme-binding domain-containing protein
MSNFGTIYSAVLVGSLLLANSVAGATPARAVIEQHLDRSVEIYGRYAPVRLPIRGVPLWNPSAIRFSPRGELFAANYVGEVYRIVDTDSDGLEDQAVLFCNVSDAGLRYPTTLAFRSDEVLVGTSQEIRVYQDRDNDGKAENSRTLLRFPCSDDPQDWTFGLCFGSDGFLYVNLSTDSYNPNPAPDPQKWRGSILRISPDGSKVEQFATGVRFAPGMSFDPDGHLFFTDNEGGGNPSEELNIAGFGEFFGHNEQKYLGHGPKVSPVARLSTARGACSIAFNPPQNDFGGTPGDLFIAFWGMGALDADGAISRLVLGRNADGSFRPREIPFARIPKVYDLTFGPSGDLYVTQFGPTPTLMTPSLTPTGSIYRIIPAPWYTPPRLQPATFNIIRGDSARGKIVFQERACAQCHSMDGATELLGPTLAHLGAQLDFQSALQEITKPSRNIRAGFESEVFETIDDEIITGRIITSEPEIMNVMIAGNQSITLERKKIRRHHSSTVSLMPEQLFADLPRKAVYDLFAYLEVREQPFRVRWRYRIVGSALIGIALGLTSWFLSKAMRT